MTDPAFDVAGDVLETVPAIMRTIARDLRHHRHRMREPSHLRVLAVLYRRDRTLGELAEAQAVSAPTMSRTVATLVERGLLARTRDPEDRRVVRVSLTDEGREVLRSRWERGRAVLAERLAGISNEDASAIQRGLTLLREHLAAEAPGVPA